MEKRKGYAIVLIDDKEKYYWVTRCGDTDNYSPEITDATIFQEKTAAICLMKVLKLDDEIIEQLNVEWR